MSSYVHCTGMRLDDVYKLKKHRTKQLQKSFLNAERFILIMYEPCTI